MVNTICRLCFSKTYNSSDPEFQQILNYTSLVVQGLQPDQLISVVPWLRHFIETQSFRNLKLGVKIRNSLTTKFFNEHIKNFDPERIRDLTDSLLHWSQNKAIWKNVGFEEVTQEQLEPIVHAIFTAGIETALSTLRWFFIYILNNPEIQTKMYGEINAKLGLKHQISAKDSEKLPYIQAVLRETNRLASVVPLNVPHKAIKDTSVRGHQILKDTQVLFNLYSMHHDPTHWEEPEEFKPERWLNADGSLKKEKATHYLPFSTGTRVCLGEKMAKMQMFLIVTRLLTNFEVSLAPGESMPKIDQIEGGLSISPASDPRIVLKRRK